MTTRRNALAALATLAASPLLTLCACSTGSPLPPLQWVRLPTDPPNPVPPLTPPSSEVWQLVLPVALPGYLERDALLVPQGAAGLQPLAGVRWAEPVRDALPRLLSLDLAARLGTPVWTSPLPPGAVPTRQIRVDVLQFDVTEGRTGVALRARWSIAAPRATTPPRNGETRLTVPTAGTDADALVLAHRAAVARLAEAIADGR